MTARFTRAAIPLLLTVFFVTTAGAALNYLPNSSHYFGTSYYTVSPSSGKIQTGRVEFAVYDTVTNPNEFVGEGSYTAPGQGRYIYAYQIFNDASNIYGMTNTSVPYFAIKTIGANAISSGSNIGTVDDPSVGINASSYGLNASRTTATFQFANGILAAGENSWFLILRSDQDWKTGTYSMESPEDSELPIPEDAAANPADDQNNPVPEPTALLVMGLGAMALARRQKK
jgi:hypothetical protein